MRIRLPTLAPLRPFEPNHLQSLGGEIQDHGGGWPMEPSARLARIDDHRVAAHAGLLLVCAAVNDDRMRRERALVYIPDVMDHENARVGDLDAVRRFVQLEPHSLRGFCLQSLPVSIVAAEHADYRDVGS